MKGNAFSLGLPAFSTLYPTSLVSGMCSSQTSLGAQWLKFRTERSSEQVLLKTKKKALGPIAAPRSMISLCSADPFCQFLPFLLVSINVYLLRDHLFAPLQVAKRKFRL